jgi:outer membrane protein assembly factor BamB
MRRIVGILLLLIFPLLMASACGSQGVRHEAAYTSSTTLTPWPTYHRSNTRSGHVATAPRGPLHRAWIRALTGQVYGEPLVVGSTLIVATERNFVYGLNARTGTTRWRVHLGTPQAQSGLPCGNIDPLGITGTPAYSAKTGSVYLVAETSGGTHTLWALKASTGARRWHRNLDTQTNRNKLAEQERAAILVTSGRVITTFGGLAGDCSNYVGYVTSVATNGQGAIRSYAVPTAREAGMWATPGAVRGPARDVYVASGNGAELNGSWDKSDSVTRLDPSTMSAKSVFAPSTWPDDNRRDLDLGSMSPAVVLAVDRLVIAGKRGTVYLLGPSANGVGSQLRTLTGCTAFGGAAVVGQTVLMPCKGENSIRALHVGASSLRWSWTRHGLYSSPVVAGGKVYVADQVTGDLVVLRLSDGSVLSRHHAGPMPHFSSQIVSGDWVFVPTLDGVTAFRGR